MKAVMPAVPTEVLRQRQETGADRFDEMWEGVLHMAPSPSVEHQSIASLILGFLLEVWRPRSGGMAFMQVNVSTPERWPRDYRIPDVAVVPAERLGARGQLFTRPSAVFEVRSPDDETYDKLGFYAAVGVESVVVVDRDTRAVQVYAVAGESFVVVPPGPDGWTRVAPPGIEVRADAGARETALLRLRLEGEAGTERSL